LVLPKKIFTNQNIVHLLYLRQVHVQIFFRFSISWQSLFNLSSTLPQDLPNKRLLKPSSLEQQDVQLELLSCHFEIALKNRFLQRRRPPVKFLTQYLNRQSSRRLHLLFDKRVIQVLRE